MTGLIGSQRLFAAYPPHTLFWILWLGVNAFVLLGRKIFEGRFYNVAVSSWLGSAMLIGCMTNAGEVLRESNLVLPSWLINPTFHVVIGAICIAAGANMTRVEIRRIGWRNMEIVDRVFNLVIGPAFMYLLFTLVPITLLRGAHDQIYWTAGELVVYALTLWYDTYTGRIHQPEWLEFEDLYGRDY